MKKLLCLILFLTSVHLAAKEVHTFEVVGKARETRKCFANETTLSRLQRSAYLQAVESCINGEVHLVSDWSDVQEECRYEPVYPGASKSWDVLYSKIVATFSCVKF